MSDPVTAAPAVNIKLCQSLQKKFGDEIAAPVSDTNVHRPGSHKKSANGSKTDIKLLKH